MEYTKALSDLIEEFNKFPGIGPKTAQRLAFSYLKKTDEQAQRHLQVFKIAKESIRYCKQCFNLTSLEECEICTNTHRDAYSIAVVAEVKDLIAIEKTREFNGKYHVLGGVMSPLDGITSADLNINQLIQRAERLLNEEEKDLEIILAIGPSTEGEATMLYIKRLIDQLNKKANNRISISRLAYGLPVGADLDYTDEITISKALAARVNFA